MSGNSSDEKFCCCEDILHHPAGPGGTRKGQLRFHSVWSGGIPFQVARMETALSTGAFFTVTGTSAKSSAQKHPDARFVTLAKGFGAPTVERNIASTKASNPFALRVTGPASKSVAAFFHAGLDQKN